MSLLGMLLEAIYMNINNLTFQVPILGVPLDHLLDNVRPFLLVVALVEEFLDQSPGNIIWNSIFT